MAEITLNLKEFGVIPIEVKSDTVLGFAKNLYFCFMIENRKDFIKNKSIYEVNTLAELRSCQK
jgi:hypothetical protein